MPGWGWYVNIEFVQRLVKRFLLFDTTTRPEAFRLSRVIIPITNADELLRAEDIYTDNVALVGTGRLNFIQVPEGERWTIHAVFFARSSGDRNIDAWGLKDLDATPIELDSFTAATEYESGVLGHPITIPEGWWLTLTTVGGSSDGNYGGKLLITIEKAF